LFFDRNRNMRLQNNQEEVASAWSPFGSKSFALLWTATLVSNTGTWMHDVGAGWLMTTLNPSPSVVSLVQTSTTLPIFLFALLAGAIADRADKKRMLLVINIVLFVTIAITAILVHQERMTPVLLLLFTLAIGAGTAFMAPAWQSVVPTLVPKTQLKAAVALNSLGVNISRAIGPALAGILITAGGLVAPFLVNALTVLAAIAALLCWRQVVKANPSNLPPERILPSMLTGLRHVRYNQPMRDTIIRASGFCFFAGAYWALLPLIASRMPGAGAELYGLLMGAIGAGAVIGALILPKLRRTISPDWLVFYGTLGTTFAMLVYALLEATAGLLAGSFLAGLGWISVLTCLSVSAQTALPDWVRARGLAVYLMVFFGSLSLGSAFWGQVSSHFSIATALLVAAILMVLVIPLTWHAKLGSGELLDLSPSIHWPAPALPDGMSNHGASGPILITITYRVAERNKHEFLQALQNLSAERYRDGAYKWDVDQDVDNPEIWVERFMVVSWHEHLRQHERVTAHDKTLQDEIRRFHIGMKAPEVKHLVATQKN
jgi:MFS family permease